MTKLQEAGWSLHEAVREIGEIYQQAQTLGELLAGAPAGSPEAKQYHDAVRHCEQIESGVPNLYPKKVRLDLHDAGLDEAGI